MTKQDVELAEALWARSKDFAQKNEHYHALLDIGAAYRLLTFSEDPRVQEVHQEWMQAYQKYADAQQAPNSLKAETTQKLEALLNQVNDRRRS